MREHEVAVFPGVSRIEGRRKSLDHSEFAPISIGGLAHSHAGIEEYVWGASVSSESSLSDALSWTGEWFGVFQRGNTREFVISSDFFGYCPVFYAFTAHGLVVSSSLRGISKELEQHEGAREVNWSSAHPHLVTHETMFNMRSSVESMRRNVWTLRPDEYLHVLGDRASVQQKSFFYDPDRRSVEELLISGIERSVAQIKSTTGAHAGKIDYSISGGKDSRAVLALLLLADAPGAVETYTHDPQEFKVGPSRDIIERDFPIALHLAKRYGLKWRKPRFSDGQRVSLEESLDQFQDWRGGQSFQFSGQLVQWVFNEGPRVEIAGGGGELYRSHFGIQTLNGYPAWSKSMAGGPDSIREDLSLLFTHMCSSELTPMDGYERARSAFVDALDSGIGGDVVEVIDSFYPLQRNRYHFGQIRYARLQDQLVLYPLAQPEFFWAHNAMPLSDRKQGRLLFELMQSADPYLNAIPFEHGQWPATFGHSVESVDVRLVDADTLDSYRQMQDARRALGTPKVASAKSAAESSRSMHTFTPDNIEWLLRNSEVPEVLRGLLPRIVMTESLGDASLKYMVAKVQTLVDAVNAPDVRVERLEFGSSQCGGALPSPRHLAGDREFLTVREKFGVADIDCKLTLEGERLAVHVTEHDGNLEVAVYLFLDGDVIEKQWYRELGGNPVFLEPKEKRSGTYRATVFLRRKGMKNPQRVVETNMVEA